MTAAIDFARPVARDGYAWWYVDAFSDDGRHGITLIAFLGSVFSPWYALARRRGRGDPLHHVSMHAVLYGDVRRWTMTERGRGALAREARHLAIGRSALDWDGDALTVRLDEVTAPIPSRLRGTVRVMPRALTGHRVTLDDAGRHRWSPIAPLARVEVALDRPALRWSGDGYLDSNDGDVPLEADFLDWHWSRAHLGGGSAILYDARRRDGSKRAIALRIDATGRVAAFDPPPAATLPPTRWRVARQTRADGEATVAATLTDAPFYARSLLRTRLLGQDTTAMHESLSLSRFRNPAVQAMLAFRIPRRPDWSAPGPG